jgi:glucose-6-phosphate isomerase
MTLTVPRIDSRVVGALIALFERAVGLYASMVGINAYHQPGVEAGKKAAATVLALQGKVLTALTDVPQTAEKLATAAGYPEEVESAFLLLEHLAANGRARIVSVGQPDAMKFCRGNIGL